MQKTAESQGFNQVLWLYGEDNQITEVGTMNLFIVHLNEKGGTFFAIFDFSFLSILKLPTKSDKLVNKPLVCCDFSFCV